MAGGSAEAGGSMGELLQVLVVDNAFGVIVEAEGLLTAGLAADGAEEALDDAECLGRASAALLWKVGSFSSRSFSLLLGSAAGNRG